MVGAGLRWPSFRLLEPVLTFPIFLTLSYSEGRGRADQITVPRMSAEHKTAVLGCQGVSECPQKARGLSLLGAGRSAARGVQHPVTRQDLRWTKAAEVLY